MRKCIAIKTDEQLMNCLKSNVEVEVWIKGRFDSVCKIEGYTEQSIKIKQGGYFLRSNIDLVTRKNYFRVQT